jgi:hypothetical protein
LILVPLFRQSGFSPLNALTEVLFPLEASVWKHIISPSLNQRSPLHPSL